MENHACLVKSFQTGIVLIYCLLHEVLTFTCQKPGRDQILVWIFTQYSVKLENSWLEWNDLHNVPDGF